MVSKDTLAIVVEFIGTFIFFSVILNTTSKDSPGAIGVAVALLAVIFFGGRVSGGHFNPGVSLMFAYRKNISWPTAVHYIMAQVAAAYVALKMDSTVLAAIPSLKL